MTGFLTLIEREFYRFIRLSRQTIFPPLVTTVMFILIFGYSLGSMISQIQGVSYIHFILPGLVMMSVVNNAFANSSTSLFMARLERSIENLISAPLKTTEIVLAYMIGGILRGVVVASVIMLTARVFVPFSIQNWGLVVGAIVLTSFLFSSLGILISLFCETWDQVSVYSTFILTPFTYLGRVFYPISRLPSPWYEISHANPVFFCVDLLRAGFLGTSDTPVWVSFSVIGLLSIVIFAISIFLFRKGYKILK